MDHTGHHTTHLLTRISVAALAAAVLAGCSTTGGTDATSEGPDAAPTTVVLATHDSWSMPEEVLAQFEEESGFDLEVRASGDAGELTNKVVLTKDNPIADVVFGIDNTFASRAVEAGALEEYTSSTAPASAADYALSGAAGAALTPVDWGDVCVNVDDAWFAERDLEPPATLDDLLDPAYEDLFVTPAASSSSPGFAFLLATIGAYGEDGWQDYWTKLMDNGAKVVAGWTDAYTVDFTAGGGDGERPIVLSYNSSPPFTIPEGAQEPTTSALLDTCFRQVEYAGVLANAENPEGARALVDFLTQRTFQEALPDNMYVFPVDDAATLPELWARWAKPAPDPVRVDPGEVAANRDEWIRAWSDLTSR